MNRLYDILQSLELGQVSAAQANDSIKQTINELIDLKDREINTYDHLTQPMREYCEMSRKHGLELAINKMRRDFLDDWNTDYPKYELETSLLTQK